MPRAKKIATPGRGLPLGNWQGRKPPTWPERIANYTRETGYPPSMSGDVDRIYGMWIMGASYKVASEYYGGYPATYLRRVRALFPEKCRVLHLFSGRVERELLDGYNVDINASLKPDWVDDAQTLTKVPLERFDLVLADPPYSVEDCEHYKTSMIKRNVVMRALVRLPPGAHVVWLDQVLPLYRKKYFQLEANIGMVKSTNHRFRVVTIWRRTAAPIDTNSHWKDK